jgi:hypothetical protein
MRNSGDLAVATLIVSCSGNLSLTLTMPLDCPDMRPERVCVLTRSMNDRFNNMELDLTEIVCRGQTT